MTNGEQNMTAQPLDWLFWWLMFCIVYHLTMYLWIIHKVNQGQCKVHDDGGTILLCTVTPLFLLTLPIWLFFYEGRQIAKETWRELRPFGMQKKFTVHVKYGSDD